MFVEGTTKIQKNVQKLRKTLYLTSSGFCDTCKKRMATDWNDDYTWKHSETVRFVIPDLVGLKIFKSEIENILGHFISVVIMFVVHH